MDTLLAEGVQQTIAALVPNRFFFTSPYRGFTTSGCFIRFDEPAMNGDPPDNPFQQKLAALSADAKAQGIKNPVMVGTIPFNPRQPPSLHIPEPRWSFPYQEKQASTHRFTRNQSLDVVEHQVIPEQTTFKQMVARAAVFTAVSQVDKMMLLRSIDITTDATIDSGVLLEWLIAQNPASYNFHVPLADGGILLETSPGLLPRKDDERFNSIPLVGSACRRSDEVLDREVGNHLLVSERDRHEHELVIQAMGRVLHKHSNELHVPFSPRLITTSVLWYLATPSEDRANSRENALILVCLLHSTLALSSFPHRTMIQVITELKPLDRKLFGDIVGWCDSESNGEWVVAIRCAKLQENQVCLFAGAGIVPVSLPLGKWRETGVKLPTMLDVFGLH